MLRFVLVVLAVVATAVVAVPAEVHMVEGETGSCDLRCWVDKLVVVVPEVSTSFTAVWVTGTFKLTNLTLKHITIGSLGGQWYPNAEANTSNAIRVDVTGVGVDIWSKFRVDWGIIHVNGEMTAVVTSTSLALAIQLNKGTDGLVELVRAPYCNLGLTIKDAKITTSSGALDLIANVIIDLFKGMIADTIEDLACSEVPKLIESNVTALFHTINDFIRPYMNTTYPRNIPIAGAMSDLRESALIDCARFIFNTFTGTEGPLNFNRVINLFTNGTGIIRLSDWYNESIVFTIPIADLGAEITIGLLDLNLTQLNTWDYIDILIPVSEVKVNGHTGLEHLGINITFFVNVTVNGSTISASEYLYESADFHIHVSNNEMWGQLQIASFTGLAAQYSNVMCTNISCIVSLLSADSTALTHLVFNTTIDLLKMLSAGGTLEADVHQTLDIVLALFLDNYKFAIPPLLNGIVGGPGTDLVNGIFYDFISGYSCTHVDDPVVSEVEVTATTLSMVTAGGASVALAAVPIWIFIRGRRDKKKQPARSPSADAVTSNEPTVEAAVIAGSTEGKVGDAESVKYGCGCGCAKGKLSWMKEFGRTDPEGASLLMDKRVNIGMRTVMPLLILICVALFISANTGSGAQVFVLLTLGSGRTVELPSLFDFGLINSIEDMWNAGVYPLAIVIAFFSGLWPYIKLVLMLITWVMPTSLFKEKWRERALMALDMLGKWSLIDSFVMVVMMVSFHFHVVFPIVNTATVDSPVMIDVFVNAAWGFNGFLLATIISLILSHIILAVHRGVKARKDENSGAEATKFKALFSYCTPKRFVIGSRIAVLVLLVVALVLVAIGVSFVSFSFDFYGLAGWALGLLGLESHREYSVVTLGAELPDSTATPDSFKVRFIQIIFMITAFILPLLHLATLICLWVIPFTRRIQKYIMIACEVMNAWSCLEVFVVSILAAILEISQFTTFMVGDKCDFIQPYIERFFADLLEGHVVCFEVAAALQSGCWLLFIACIIYIIASMIVMRVCRSALEKRMPPAPIDAQFDDINMQTRRLESRSSSRGINESHSHAYSSDASSGHPSPAVVPEHDDSSPALVSVYGSTSSRALVPPSNVPPPPEPATQLYPAVSPPLPHGHEDDYYGERTQATLVEEPEVMPTGPETVMSSSRSPPPPPPPRTLSRPAPPPPPPRR